MCSRRRQEADEYFLQASAANERFDLRLLRLSDVLPVASSSSSFVLENAASLLASCRFSVSLGFSSRRQLRQCLGQPRTSAGELSPARGPVRVNLSAFDPPA